jgi:hypothetical protein
MIENLNLKIKWEPILRHANAGVNYNKLVLDLDMIEAFCNGERHAPICISVMVKLFNSRDQNKIKSIPDFCEKIKQLYNSDESKSYFAVDYEAELISMIVNDISNEKENSTESLFDELDRIQNS